MTNNENATFQMFKFYLQSQNAFIILLYEYKMFVIANFDHTKTYI